MTEKYRGAVEGKSTRRRSRISLGKLQSPDRATLDSIKTGDARETVNSFSSIQHMRRASFNVASSTGNSYHSVLLAGNSSVASTQKSSFEPNEELKNAKNRRRQSELLPSQRLFLQEHRLNSPKFNPAMILNLRTISSIDLEEESDHPPLQFYPTHLRSRILLSPISPTIRAVPKSPPLSPAAVENYWSETAQVLSVTGGKKLERRKWSKAR